MGKITIPGEILIEIYEKTGNIATPQIFLEVFQNLRGNQVLTEILSMSHDNLKEQIQKLAYAKLVLSDDMYREIGEGWITDPGMTLDKICTIGIGDPETVGLMGGGLTLEQTQAMTGEWLAHSEMTMDKITLLGFGATLQQIYDIGPENIAKMSQKELDSKLTWRIKKTIPQIILIEITRITKRIGEIFSSLKK